MAATESIERGTFGFVTFKEAAACVVAQDPHVLDSKMESDDTDIESISSSPKGGADGRGGGGGGRRGRGGGRGRSRRGKGAGGAEPKKNERNRIRKNETERKRVLYKRKALDTLQQLMGPLGPHDGRWTEAEILRSTQTLIKKLKEDIVVAVTTTRMTRQLRSMDLSLAENLGANCQ